MFQFMDYLPLPFTFLWRPWPAQPWLSAPGSTAFGSRWLRGQRRQWKAFATSSGTALLGWTPSVAKHTAHKVVQCKVLQATGKCLTVPFYQYFASIYALQHFCSVLSKYNFCIQHKVVKNLNSEIVELEKPSHYNKPALLEWCAWQKSPNSELRKVVNTRFIASVHLKLNVKKSKCLHFDMSKGIELVVKLSVSQTHLKGELGFKFQISGGKYTKLLLWTIATGQKWKCRVMAKLYPREYNWQ